MSKLKEQTIKSHFLKKEEMKKKRKEKGIYTGAIVLGLNDALVELTGALAGLTLALQESKTIAITGFIVGCAAALSMAVSEYLSAKEELRQNKKKNPLKSSIYTGITYITTVLILILPYFILSNVYLALSLMLLESILIIFFYTFHISTIKGISPWKKFREMVILSLSVAFISFIIGWLVKDFR